MRKSFIDNWLYLSAGFLPGRVRGWAAGLAAGVFFFGSVATGLEPVAVLAPSDVPPGWGNYFGWSVAISGRYVAVGAPREPWFNGDATGAVYVFRRQGARWIEQAKLTASDPEWQAELGWSVAMDGDVIVAGAPAWEFTACIGRRPGAAYVFRRDDWGTPDDPTDDTWNEEAKLVPPPIFALNAFGESVAMSGDMVVVGSPCGGAAVFRRTGDAWGHEITFVGAYSFGELISAKGPLVGICAPGESYECTGQGSCRGVARLFQHFGGDWYQVAELTDPTASGFGTAISVLEEGTIVGDLGSAHHYVKSNEFTWQRQQVLPAPDSFALDFGATTAMSGDALIVGAPSDYEHGSHSGAAFVYYLDNGELGKRSKLTFAGLQPSNSLGKSIAVDGDYSVIGSWAGAFVYRTCLSCGTLLEIAGLQNCFSGAAPQGDASCVPLDFIRDGKVNVADFVELSALLVGP